MQEMFSSCRLNYHSRPRLHRQAWGAAEHNKAERVEGCQHGFHNSGWRYVVVVVVVVVLSCGTDHEIIEPPDLQPDQQLALTVSNRALAADSWD